MNLFKPLIIAVFWAVIFTGCSTHRSAANFEDMKIADITPDSLLTIIPDYSEELYTMSGNGRALVSEPGNNERVTVEFQSDRQQSLLTIRTSIGIEGGQILIDSDSVLIYNKVDKFAQKVSPEQSTISSVGSIASLNMLDLFNFRIEQEEIDRIFDDGSRYVVLLKNEAIIEIDKSTGLIQRVDRSHSAPPLAYRTIEYEGYAEISGFQLPRKITIFSGDGQSRATFLVQRLYVNGKLPPLAIQLPEDIPIYRP